MSMENGEEEFHRLNLQLKLYETMTQCGGGF